MASFSPRLFCEGGVEVLCALASFVSEHVINRPLGVLIAMAVMALPTSFSIFDGALREERAEAFFRALGFSGLRLLLLLLLSLRSATASARVFSWIRSFGELGVLLIFASYPMTASIYILQAWHIYRGRHISQIPTALAEVEELRRRPRLKPRRLWSP